MAIMEVFIPRSVLIGDAIERPDPDEQPAPRQPEDEGLGEEMRIERQSRFPGLVHVAYGCVHMRSEADTRPFQEPRDVGALSSGIHA